VETLPGGGSGNTFYDFVGPSPINLWTSSDEYGLLRTVSCFVSVMMVRQLTWMAFLARFSVLDSSTGVYSP
jgi:hypothetical protein